MTEEKDELGLYVFKRVYSYFVKNDRDRKENQVN
jgi:hypothetical protein